MTLSFEKPAEPAMFRPEEVQDLDLDHVPKHVAIVMDGNRRWAALNNLPIEFGHAKGSERLKKIVQAAIELKIQTLTVYSFSTENKNRSPEEISNLFMLFKQYLLLEKETMIENGIRFQTIGDLSFFPNDLRELLEETKRSTSCGNKLNLVVAMNYGSRNEIKRAVQRIAEDCQNKKIDSSEISEALISRYLDTAPFSDPELLIRTSGEFRLSNFLLWQISYAEVVIVRKYWPEFKPRDLLNVIKNYQEREIRRGI
jgi:undecaprenyl diphosphate synthase